jgi:hypothetical protein
MNNKKKEKKKGVVVGVARATIQENYSFIVMSNGLISDSFSRVVWFFCDTVSSFSSHFSDRFLCIPNPLHIPYSGIVSFFSPLVPLFLRVERMVVSVCEPIYSCPVKTSKWKKINGESTGEAIYIISQL